MGSQPIVIDGSQGEGGGQILRTAVALAGAWGLDVRVVNIRANRSPPGIRPQHLAALRAAATICRGELDGAAVGSREIVFRPGPLCPGDYHFDIHTAGSATLVAQTVLPLLALAPGDSTVRIVGGTHNPWAPCFEYLRDVFGVLAAASNLQMYFERERAGFYPAGGGRIRLEVRGLDQGEDLDPLRYATRGDLQYIEGLSAASDSLPAHIVERQATQALGRLAAAGHRATLEQASWETHSPGTVVFLRAVFSRSAAGFFALGQRGKPAERVADEAVDQLLDFLAAQAAVDAHAADQLITLAALCPQESHFTTQRITTHLETNAAVIRQLTGREIRLEGQPGQAGRVVVEDVE